MNFNLQEILAVSFILFAVIDILGCIPFIIELKQKYGKIQSLKTITIVGLIMLLFLFTGEYLLKIMGVDMASFAIAGSVILFIMALEMVVGIHIFRYGAGGTSVVPLAFPMLAGVGTITTLLSLRAIYSHVNVVIAIIINLGIIFLVLKTIPKIESILGNSGIEILRKVFGIVLLAIAVKLFKNYLLM